MPNTATFIDDLRSAFGREAIDSIIRRGMKGEAGCFHATEAGHEVGTPFEKRAWVSMKRPPEGKR